MSRLQLPSNFIRHNPNVSGRMPIRLDYRRFGEKGRHIAEHPMYTETGKRAVQSHALMMEGKSPQMKDRDTVMTGWKTESPFIKDSELETIQKAAKSLSLRVDDFFSIGIGGSYLGIRATIEAVKGSLESFNLLSRVQRGGAPRIFFLGQNLDPGYIANILTIMKGKRVGGCVISKSGDTVEPAIAFAVMMNLMGANYKPEELSQRIVAITDRTKGSLRQLSRLKQFQTFAVPENVGGRFSVTCPVGLFSLAVAGVDIKEFIAGARFAEERVRKEPFERNIAMQRAVMRYLAHKQMGKDIELASTTVADLRSVTSWMQQLGPESEGKNGEGLWISPEFYTEMAHANGEMIELGKRNLIETFLCVEKPSRDITIHSKGTPVEYLDGRPISFANSAFGRGLRDAHFEVNVPTMSYLLPDTNAFTLGQLYQYEMNAIAISGLLLGQNPFVQPGVQHYKDIATIRSGKPGTENMALPHAHLDPRFII